MTYNEFLQSLSDDEAPSTMDPALQALWEDGRGDWESAHRLVQDEETPEAAWVHAYLHRKEGDIANAGYWYRRSDQPICDLPLESEWEQIARSLTASRIEH